MEKKVSLQDLPQFCWEFVKKLKGRELILLSGPLGAGKTKFVKYCVQALHGGKGANEALVDSPTFSIINEYGGQPPVYHVDLYRLASADEVESTGFWDLFSVEQGIIFVEWPEQVPEKDFPVYWNTSKVKIDFTADPQVRNFRY
jgi:tRNA threonylcarbamoyladenosine biosynthesis protein TsaE